MTAGADAALAAFARRSIAGGSKSFAGAARLLDPSVRTSASLLYAWCRHCDDVIDGQEMGFRQETAGAADPAAKLAGIRALTEAALAGHATDQAPFQALQAVVRRHGIPSRYPRHVIDGFAMDVQGASYDTLSDTLVYAYRVAGAVGVMMAMVMGARDEDTLDRACDLGIAFQLTNIARDVVEDAAAGRVYLPGDWLREAGLDGRTLADPGNRQALAGVVARLLETAEHYYDSALVGIAALPARSALAIAGARAVYRAIGLKVLALGPAAWDARVSTTRAEKLRLLTGAALSRVRPAPASARTDRSRLWTRGRELPRASA